MRSSDSENVEDLADLYNNAPCGYASLTPDGKIALANQTLADWLGFSVQDLQSHHIHDVLSIGGRIAFETNLSPVLRLRGRIDEVAIDLITADGRTIPCIANAAEKRSAKGAHLFTRLTIFPAVDRRTFEKSLLADKIKAEEQARNHAEQLVLRDQLVAVLGHDLRNPLAAVRSGLRLLARDGLGGERAMAIADEMERSIDRALQLIEDILDFARGTLGSGIPVERKVTNELGDLLEQLLQEVALGNPGRTFEHHFNVAHPVHCDLPRIGQLASNLLFNAVFHGEESEPVTLLAETSETYFSLSVKNAGTEIDPETLTRLFRPFEKGTENTSSNGLGLGLFIVNEIAEAHQGQMTVTSRDGETVFTLTMPRTAKITNTPAA